MRTRFPFTVRLVEQDAAYSFLSLVAEIGGNLGLFLGFSFYDWSQRVNIVPPIRRVCRV
jgi:Amiloride-sensitive sodium channel